MTVTTSRGKTFTINWMWGPVGRDAVLRMEYADDRSTTDIAADFEGIEHFHRESDTEGDMDWDGYTNLDSIVRDRQYGTVMLAFSQPAKDRQDTDKRQDAVNTDTQDADGQTESEGDDA